MQDDRDGSEALGCSAFGVAGAACVRRGCSCRTASVGSIEAARRAGARRATTATASSRTVRHQGSLDRASSRSGDVVENQTQEHACQQPAPTFQDVPGSTMRTGSRALAPSPIPRRSLAAVHSSTLFWYAGRAESPSKLLTLPTVFHASERPRTSCTGREGGAGTRHLQLWPDWEVGDHWSTGTKTMPSGSSPAGIVRTTMPRLMSMTEMVSSPMLAA